MQYKIGDQVMHTSHGSGQIVAIEEKQSSGDETRLFYAVLIERSTVWVPVDTDNALRPLVSNNAIVHCRDLLKSRPSHSMPIGGSDHSNWLSAAC